MKIPKTVQLTYGDSPGNRNLINAINGNIRNIVNYLLHLDITARTRETLRVGETKQLAITATPADAALTYVSSNAAIATVSSGGLVTAIAVGEVTITTTGAKSGLTSGTMTIDFIVISNTQVKLEVSEMVVESEVFTILNVGETKQLTVSVTPIDSSLGYVSSDESIATVSSTGIVTAVAEGQIDITITGAKTGLTSGTAVVVFKIIPTNQVKVINRISESEDVQIEYKRATYSDVTTIQFSQGYPYPPVITAGLMYDYATPGEHGVGDYDISPIVELIITQVGGVNYYTSCKVHWKGSPPSSIANAYTTIIAVCRLV